jgi:SP family galactose:H+ symporter-like MFS transporter
MHIATIAATAALGGLLIGYDTGAISGALPLLREAFHLSSHR